jgi:hypothetical protein
LALIDRDVDLLREALDAILTDHARALDRKASPPPPVSEVAVHFAAAATRLGMTPAVDPRFRAWPVVLGSGSSPADLLGEELWRRRP